MHHTQFRSALFSKPAWRQWLVVAACGFLAPIWLVLSHEAAHFLAARALGWDAELHWAWVSVGDAGATAPAIRDVTEVEAALAEYRESLSPTERRQVAVFSLSGPIQTLVFGVVAALLWRRRRRVAEGSSTVTDWLLLGTAAFLIRSPLVAVETAAADMSWLPTSIWGDEVTAAAVLGLPRYSLVLLFAAASVGALLAIRSPLLAFLRAHRVRVVGFATWAVVSSLVWDSLLGPSLLP